MTEVMYGTSSAVIALALLACMIAALHLGRHLGRRGQHETNDASNQHVNALQGTLLGLLALLLGFTLSLSLQRFDERSVAVVAEANAISNAYVHSRLAPQPQAGRLRELLGEYTHQRVVADDLSVIEQEARRPFIEEARRLQDEMSTLVIDTPEAMMGGAVKTYLLRSLDSAFDVYEEREAGLDRHVPETVLWLLFITFVAAGGVVGYAMGLNGARNMVATHIMVVLIVVLVFVIIDLDRPRRGLIEVDQKYMIELDAKIRKEAAPR